jgi:hypothetical protein
MALIHLIYTSSAATPLADLELDRILESSLRHNTQQHLTGMLLYAGGNFMQILEGEEAAVDETYNRITNDPRHTGILLINHQPIMQREFFKWSMGFRRKGKADAALHPGYEPFFECGFDAASIGASPGLGLKMLREFALNQR